MSKANCKEFHRFLRVDRIRPANQNGMFVEVLDRRSLATESFSFGECRGKVEASVEVLVRPNGPPQGPDTLIRNPVAPTHRRFPPALIHLWIEDGWSRLSTLLEEAAALEDVPGQLSGHRRDDLDETSVSKPAVPLRLQVICES